jgi:chromosome segregation ATPase
MNLILRYLEGRKAVPASSDPALKAQLEQTKKDLNSILTEWNWSGVHPKTSQEFLNKFRPWVNEKIELDKELKVFLSKKGVLDLKEADSKLTNRDLSENEELNQLNQELTSLKQELKTFLDKNSASSLQEWEQTWSNTEQDYLRQIDQLKNRPEGETPADYEELITELDEARRAQGELEQELLFLNNKLKLKQQEVQNKENSLQTLKKEKNQQEASLNKKLTEKNGLITTLQREVNQLKEKYSKKSQLLDQEQLEGKRLEEENEKLQKEVGRLIQALNDEINNKGGGILE